MPAARERVTQQTRSNAGGHRVGHRVRLLASLLAGLFAGLSAGHLIGCVAVQPSASFAPANDPPEPPAQERSVVSDQGWPARWGAPDAPRGVIVPSAFGPAQLRTAHLGRFHRLRLGTMEYEHAEALAEAVGRPDGFRFEAEAPGALVFLPPEDPDEAPRAPRPDDPFETVVFVSGTPLARTNTEDRVSIERTWISFYDPHRQPGALPDAQPDASPKGTIVLIPGMLGTPQPVIEGMIRYWRRSGYAVVRLLSHPSRFTEHAGVPIRPAEIGQIAERLAGLYDGRTAECAYAVDAGLSAFFERRAAYADRPVVLVGMSGGAMVLPSVAAYAPHRYAASVLIAGGSDFLTISATSNYADWIDAVELDWTPDDPADTGEPDDELLDELARAYLGASRLDAARTAPLLRGPRLMLHASSDQAVPSAQGDALWEQLGRPERWIYPVGHELIFVMLPTQAERLGAWIDRAITEPAP